MTYRVDLTENNSVTSVGYLAGGHSFNKGIASEAILDRLVALVEQPLGVWSGYHTCNLGWCGLRLRPLRPTFRYKGRVIGLGDADIFVPGDGTVYSAPSLIIHYIRRHRYLPPSCFVEAVFKCPEPHSQEYRVAIKRIAPELVPRLGIR
jgi:hypothetical protein